MTRDGDPFGVWGCGAIEDGRECTAVVVGQRAEKAEHQHTAHPRHTGIAWLRARGQILLEAAGEQR
jgi:hypothetical protein